MICEFVVCSLPFPLSLFPSVLFLLHIRLITPRQPEKTQFNERTLTPTVEPRKHFIVMIHGPIRSQVHMDNPMSSQQGQPRRKMALWYSRISIAYMYSTVYTVHVLVLNLSQQYNSAGQRTGSWYTYVHPATMSSGRMSPTRKVGPAFGASRLPGPPLFARATNVNKT